MNDKHPLPSNMDIITVLKNSNLTPSQKVSVITEINSKTQPSKNLSHVPCRFFRQGACQAGNACPFSHSIDIQTNMQPCKYFQKGNCKFGSKCALSHILPDGSKPSARNYSKHIYSNANLNQDSNSNSHSYLNSNSKSSPPNSTSIDSINTEDPKYSSGDHFALTSPQLFQNSYQQVPQYSEHYTYEDFNTSPSSNPSIIAHPSAALDMSDSGLPTFNANMVNNSNISNSGLTTSSIWSNANGPASSGNESFSSGNGFVLQTNNTILNNTNTQSFMKSFSFSNSTPTPTATASSNYTHGMNFRSSFSNSFSSPFDQTSSNSSFNQPTYSSSVENAIVDTDDETEDLIKLARFKKIMTITPVDEKDNEDEEFDDTEDVDFIPSSLNDLLTPQELTRRKARASFGSGTVNIDNTMSSLLAAVHPATLAMDDETPFIME